MKTRFFYAPFIQHNDNKSTWAKLFVLTSDGTLYCEYLDQKAPAIVKKQFNYSTFRAFDYIFRDYQHLQEISYEEARMQELTEQENWIDRYLESKGITKT